MSELLPRRQMYTKRLPLNNRAARGAGYWLKDGCFQAYALSALRTSEDITIQVSPWTVGSGKAGGLEPIYFELSFKEARALAILLLEMSEERGDE